MPVSETGAIPEGAVDVSDEVIELKDQITDLFQGHSFAVVGLAVGTAIGEAFDDHDDLKHYLTSICETAATIFAVNLMDQAAGGSIN